MTSKYSNDPWWHRAEEIEQAIDQKRQDRRDLRRARRQRIAARVRYNVRVLMGAEDPVG